MSPEKSTLRFWSYFAQNLNHDLRYHKVTLKNMEKEDETPAPAPVAPETAEEEVEFRVYRRRWLVLTAVSMSNIAINILLYSYSTVANDAAAYFDKETSDINTFTTIGMVASLIVSLFATWLIERLGLRWEESCWQSKHVHITAIQLELKYSTRIIIIIIIIIIL